MIRLLQRQRRQAGFSLIELLIVIAIILILAAIAIPNFSKQRMNANETAAIRQIRDTINPMQAQYYSQFGRFATTLAELGPPTSGPEGPAAAGLIPKTLAEGKNTGYIFAITKTAVGYAVTAVPEVFGGTGRRTFYSDESQVIHQNWGQEPATVQSPEFKQ